VTLKKIIFLFYFFYAKTYLLIICSKKTFPDIPVFREKSRNIFSTFYA